MADVLSQAVAVILHDNVTAVQNQITVGFAGGQPMRQSCFLTVEIGKRHNIQILQKSVQAKRAGAASNARRGGDTLDVEKTLPQPWVGCAIMPVVSVHVFSWLG